MKHLAGLLSHEEAQLAKTRLADSRRAGALVTKERRAELLKQYEAERAAEVELNRKKVRGHGSAVCSVAICGAHTDTRAARQKYLYLL